MESFRLEAQFATYHEIHKNKFMRPLFGHMYDLYVIAKKNKMEWLLVTTKYLKIYFNGPIPECLQCVVFFDMCLFCITRGDHLVPTI